MDDSPLSAGQVRRYLELLGIERERPSLAALRALVHAHALRIPFETVSKLYYLRTRGLAEVVDVELYLEGIRLRSFGGTCYSNNLHLWRLLAALGYDATLCGADMPAGEDVHAAITVAVRGRDWLVDAGNAAPFLAPLPLGLDRPWVLQHGVGRYVLSPRDAQGRFRLEVWQGEEAVHWYLLKPGMVAPDSFDRAVANSFRPDATFMNAVLLVRCHPRRLVRIVNLSLVRATRSRRVVEPLADREAFVAAVEREFGIAARVCREAIAGIPTFGMLYPSPASPAATHRGGVE